MIRKTFSVKRKTADEVLAEFPQLLEVDVIDDEYDIFICSSGFEDRVISAPRTLAEQGIKIPKVLVGKYCTNVADNDNKYLDLEPILCKVGGDIVFFSADSPDLICKAISTELVKVGNGARVAVDISGASSTLIVSVLFAILTADIVSSLTVFYATAESYHEPTLADRMDPVNLWSESDYREVGVDGVDVNELIPGLHQDSSPSYVIAFPSMFSARLERCLNYLGIVPQSGSEECAFWVFPTAGKDEHEWRQGQIHNMVAKLVYGGEEDSPKALPEDRWCSCDALDYKQSAKILYKQIDSKSGANISVVHFGTKIQAVGVALALVGRKEVSLVNARPSSFSASSYSKGIGKLYRIDFGDTKIVLEALSSVGSLMVNTL